MRKYSKRFTTFYKSTWPKAWLIEAMKTASDTRLAWAIDNLGMV